MSPTTSGTQPAQQHQAAEKKGKKSQDENSKGPSTQWRVKKRGKGPLREKWGRERGHED